MLKQIKTVKYLLSLPEVRSEAETSVNHKGLRACDLLVGDDDQFPRDFKSLKIQCILMDANLTSSQNRDKPGNNKQLAASKRKKKSGGFFLRRWWRKLKELLKYKGQWMDDKRGSIMVVATVIGTMTFTTAMSPPGGTWQETTIESFNGMFKCSKENMCLAGTSVMAQLNPDTYSIFLLCISLSFLASISAILLLVSGFPIKNKICMWLLTMAMCGALTFMAIAFLIGLRMVSPNSMVEIYIFLVFSWFGVLSFVCLLQTIRLLVWLVRKLCGCCRPKKKKKKPIENTED
ncbi:uncharacterized protein LOC21396629 [Morus notabilis]|nr:uncharacterized protein LOC21396629 [Morus notabilis]